MQQCDAFPACLVCFAFWPYSLRNACCYVPHRWIDNQGGNGDQDAANGAGKKDAMTLSQLSQTLENFCKLLARSGLERHVDFFT